jgi:hypothetical protein
MNGGSGTVRQPILAARGGISWVTLLLLALLAGGAYLAWVWGPVYVVHYEVNQVARDFMNRAVRNPDDAALVEEMCRRIRALREVEVVLDDGRVELAPAAPVHPQDVTWRRDVRESSRTLQVSFSYPRTVAHPWIGLTIERTFEVDLEQDISPVRWDPKD